MLIRKLTVLSLFILGLALAPFSFGQFAKPAQTPIRVLGYYDPATGTFSPVRQSEPEVDAPAATTEAGELIIKFTITVKSAIPKNGAIGCGVIASLNDTAGSYAEKASGIATLVSGSTYTCSAIIHYSWLLATPTSDKISFNNSSVTIDYGYQVTATNGTAILVQPVEARGSAPPIPSINVPANGATATVDVSVTL